MGQAGPNTGIFKLWNPSQDMPTLLLGGHSLGVGAANCLAYSPGLSPLPWGTAPLILSIGVHLVGLLQIKYLPTILKMSFTH